MVYYPPVVPVPAVTVASSSAVSTATGSRSTSPFRTIVDDSSGGSEVEKEGRKSVEPVGKSSLVNEFISEGGDEAGIQPVHVLGEERALVTSTELEVPTDDVNIETVTASAPTESHPPSVEEEAPATAIAAVEAQAVAEMNDAAVVESTTVATEENVSVNINQDSPPLPSEPNAADLGAQDVAAPVPVSDNSSVGPAMSDQVEMPPRGEVTTHVDEPVHHPATEPLPLVDEQEAAPLVSEPVGETTEVTDVLEPVLAADMASTLPFDQSVEVAETICGGGEVEEWVEETADHHISPTTVPIPEPAGESNVPVEETVESWEIEASTDLTPPNPEVTATVATPPVPTPPTSQAYIPPKRDKKSLKAAMANADANADNKRGGLLDAYIDTPIPTPIASTPPPSTTSPPPTTTAATAATPQQVVQSEPELDDDWEATADKQIDLKPIPTPTLPEPTAPRRLAPGGGKLQTRLNQGPQSIDQSKGAKPRYIYIKDDILKMKPTVIPDKPSSMSTYTNITVHEENEKGRILSTKIVTTIGFWSRAETAQPKPVFDRSQRDTHVQSAKDSGRGSTGGGGGGSGRGGGGGGGDGSSSGWARGVEAPLPPSQQSQSQQGGYSTKRLPPRGMPSMPPMIRPTKVITDPTIQLTNEVMQILNKITPQTFEKLTSKMCEIPVPTNALLDKLIEMIFEKAIQV